MLAYQIHGRVVGTLLAGLGAAIIFSELQAPLPWMIGPLLFVSVLSMVGMPTSVPIILRNGAQLTMGALLGMSFTPDVIRVIGSMWWLLALALAWSFCASWITSLWFSKVLTWITAGRNREAIKATAYFSSALGGAAEMTMAADRNGGLGDFVAAAQSIRVLLAAVLIPMAMQIAGPKGGMAIPVHLGHVSPYGLTALLSLALIGATALRLTRFPSPWFLGPLLLVAACSSVGWSQVYVPSWILHCAQLLIACSLGARFKRQFLRAAPIWLMAVVASSLGLIAVAAGSAWFVGYLSGVPVATLVLSLSPANITEMALTAKTLQLSVAIVIATQAFRMVIVLMTAELFFKFMKNINAAGPLIALR